MTAKRFIIGVCESGLGLTDNETKEQYLEVDDTTLIRLCEVLNGLSEENEQLKIQLQNTSDQRDEFHRGARENANRVGKLEKENEQLKQQLESEHTMLDNAILLERTRMGQNSLKQYKEAIQ